MERTQSAFWLSVVIVSVALGCSSATPPSDTTALGCKSDADCKGDRVCVRGVCESATGGDSGTCKPSCLGKTCGPNGCGGTCGTCPGGQMCNLGSCTTGSATCQDPGETCTLSSECCTGSNSPKGAVCLSDDSTCHAICNAASECTSGCCVSLEGQSYGACAAKSYCLAGVGDKCSTSADCGTGLTCGALGWCTKSCTRSTECAGKYTGGKNQYGFGNYCYTTSGGGKACFPGCSTTTTCSNYKAGGACSYTATVDGYSAYSCGG